MFDACCEVCVDDEELAASYDAYSSFAVKLVLNAVSTGAMVLRGAVAGNDMINVGPTNDKIYHRCLRLVQKHAQRCRGGSDGSNSSGGRCGSGGSGSDDSGGGGGGRVTAAEAEHALLRAIYRVDELPAGCLDLPTSAHIKVATPANDDEDIGDLKLLPLAILLAAGAGVGAGGAGGAGEGGGGRGGRTVAEVEAVLRETPNVRQSMRAAQLG